MRAATARRCRSTSTRSRCCATSGRWPSRASSACRALALEAGAHGITVHPRPDERHIRRHDVFELAALLKDWPQAEFNIEGNPFHNLMELVREAAAAAVHLRARQRRAGHLRPRLGPGPRRRAAEAADRRGARARRARQPVHGCRRRRRWPRRAPSAPTASSSTPSPTRAPTARPGRRRRSPRFAAAARAAAAQGLGVNAGHDLNLANLGDFVRRGAGRARGLDRPRASSPTRSSSAWPRRCAPTSPRSPRSQPR